MQCTGPSMLPTFNPKGDILLYEHFSTNFGRIQIGGCSWNAGPCCSLEQAVTKWTMLPTTCLPVLGVLVLKTLDMEILLGSRMA